jgi:hypothetical protein
MTISNLYNFIRKYDYEILFISAIVILLILSIMKLCTYTSNYFSLRSSKKNLNYFSEQQSSPSQPKDSSGEIECRRVLEKIFNKPFYKSRPDFLRNFVVGTNNLELDCFNEELRIAVEYNGQQHYKFIPYFHRTKDAFHNQKYRDNIKAQICKERGITLIEVPYTIKKENIKSFIIQKLHESGRIQ